MLKPVDDEPEARWLAELTRSVRENGFRVSRPIAAADGRWIVDGWSAWSWVSGAHSATRWPELLAAAAAFHETLSGAPRPEFIDRRADRWRIAARVAWGELPWAELRDTIHLAALVAARGPVTLPAQLVHCDLTGNVLFEPGLPPAIIDLSLHWRPPSTARHSLSPTRSRGKAHPRAPSRSSSISRSGASCSSGRSSSASS